MDSSYGLLILAGGKASRLKDKPFVEFKGTPMIKYIFNSLKHRFGEVAVSAKKEHEERIKTILGNDVKIICDSVDAYSPVFGILSMEKMKSDNIFIVPCDTPYASFAFDKILSGFCESDYDVAVPKWENNIEPLIGLYKRKRMISACKISIYRKKLAVVDTFAFLKVNYINFADGKIFKNINTPEDLNDLNF